jgi:hypothetical protein
MRGWHSLLSDAGYEFRALPNAATDRSQVSEGNAADGPSPCSPEVSTQFAFFEIFLTEIIAF